MTFSVTHLLLKIRTWICSSPQSIRLILVLEVILDVAHLMVDSHKVLHIHFGAHLDPV